MGAYLLFLNSAIAFMVFGVLVASWWHSRRAESLLLIIASALAVISGGFEASLAWLDNAHLPRFLLFATHLGGLMFLSAGVAAYFAARFNWRLVTVLYISMLMVNLTIIDMDRDSLLRQTIYQAPYLAMGLTGAVIAWLHGRTTVDRLFALALSLFALQYGIRPGIAIFTGGVGTSPSQFLATHYGALILFIQAVTGLMLACTMIWLIGARLLGDVRQRYAHDPKTGLMTRSAVADRFASAARGSGGQVLALIEPVSASGFPDLESERRQHAALDRLVGLVRPRLDETMHAFRAGDTRIGILFEERSSENARQWCERITGEDSQGPARFAAGLAAQQPGESFDTLAERAAEALYHARSPGGPGVCLRDMVRYVPPRPSPAGALA